MGWTPRATRPGRSTSSPGSSSCSPSPSTRSPAGCRFAPAADPSAGGAREIALREGPRLPADFRAEPTAGEVVGGDMDAAVDAGKARLVRGVVVRRPPKSQRFARPALELEIARGEGLCELSSGEV